MTPDLLLVRVPAAWQAAVAAALAGSHHGPFSVVGEGDEADVRLEPIESASVDGQERAAVVAVASAEPTADAALAALHRGVQDVLRLDELRTPSLGWRLRAASERRRLTVEGAHAYSTDLGTGLPHRQQLIEHMSHLMALRERQPAPMAVLVLRIEGLSELEAQSGREASQVLRRKLAVRLRAGVRASDVVASLGDDAFAVLLAALLVPADAQLVAGKLSASLQSPLGYSGQQLHVGVALGVAQYPADGRQPEALLQQAEQRAAAATAQGHAQRRGGAANDPA